jgi:tetratricopeptide (TPR) repeat protein
MKPHTGRFSFTQKYEFGIRRARHLHDQGEHVEEKALLLELQRTPELDPRKQIDVLVQLGNAEVRLGDVTAGLARFGQAVQISRRRELTDQRAKAEIALGWGYRLIGQLDDAAEHYRDALLIAVETGNEEDQARLLNNLAYVCALRRRREAALQLCHQALSIWEKRIDERGMGIVFGTMATILLEFGQFKEALPYRQRALNIFEPMSDLEKEVLSTNRYMRGVNYWLLGNLDAARKDLESAQGTVAEHERHIVVHYLAQMCRDHGEVDQALARFEESLRLSESLPDPFYEMSNRAGIVGIARDKRQFSRWRELEGEARSYKAEWPMVEHKLPEGLLWKYLGDLAFGDAQLDKAIQLYQQGLPLIAEAGTYEPYTLSRQLQETERLFQGQADCLRGVGQALMRFWLDEELDREHPEALFFFARWEHLGDTSPEE